MKLKFSRSATAVALRRFVFIGLAWAVYDNVMYSSGPVFTRLMLSIGADERHIGYLASLVSIAGFVQIAAVRYSMRLIRHTGLLLLIGALEVALGPMVYVPYLLVSRGYLGFQDAYNAIIVILMASFAMGNFLAPAVTQWLGGVMRPESRGKYVALRMTFISVMGVITLTLAGMLLDLPERFAPLAFGAIFLAAAVGGVAGFLILIGTPQPETPPEPIEEAPQRPAKKFTADFRWFLLFHFIWFFGIFFAQAFFNVFMLKQLSFTNSRVAMMANIGIGSYMVGCMLAGLVIDRFGCRGLIQLLIIPLAASRAGWALVDASNAERLIPLWSALGGLSFGGIITGVNTLLFKLSPVEEGSPARNFAWFAVASTFAVTAGPAVGSFMLSGLGSFSVEFYWFRFGALQFVFLASSLILLISFFFSFFFEEKAASPIVILSRVTRGNILSFVFNYLYYHVARDGADRARAVRGMARSKSPVAEDFIKKALDHPEKPVRSAALRGLGDMAPDEAEDTLIRTLDDSTSDLRAVAAETLGKIPTPRSIQRLRGALTDADPRVREGAVAALSGIGTPEAVRILLERLRGPFDRELFPSLVEALARRRAVEAALSARAHLDDYSAYPVRMQLTNSICRALGDHGAFYDLLGMGQLNRMDSAQVLITGLRKKVGGPFGSGEAGETLDRAIQCLASEDFGGMIASMAVYASGVAPKVEGLRVSYANRAMAIIGILIANASDLREKEISEEDWIFALALFLCLLRVLAKKEK